MKFGYSVVRRECVPKESEQQIITRIRAERDAGATLQAIADGLNSDGLPAKLGGRWYRWGVRRVVEQNSKVRR